MLYYNIIHIMRSSSYKVQIYISDNFCNFYFPFVLYRNIIYNIFKENLTTNIEYVYNIEDIDNTENTIIIMNIYCLHYINKNNLFPNINKTKKLVINTEFYKNHYTNEIIEIIDMNECDFYILEYNVLNYDFFKDKYKNVNIFFAPLIYDPSLETYYKNQIENKYIEWNEKDIDVLFVGSVNDRRRTVLDKIAQKYNVNIIENFLEKEK